MLLCCDKPGPIYVKVGVTDNPMQRLSMLTAGCAVTPIRFMFVAVRSRAFALALEKSLLSGFSVWHTKGEWFKVKKSEKHTFNSAWKEAFSAHAEKHWPLGWVQMSVSSILALNKEKKVAFFKSERAKEQKYGAAYMDFKKAQ